MEPKVKFGQRFKRFFLRCPVCKEWPVRHSFSLPYTSTFKHWGFDISSIESIIGLSLDDYKFDVARCDSCGSFSVKNGYKGLPEYIETHPYVFSHLGNTYYSLMHPVVDADYISKVKKGLDEGKPNLQRHQWTLRLLQGLGAQGKNCRFLDLGAALGTVGRLADMILEIDVTFCETNPLSASILRERYKDAKVYSCVLEHILDVFDIIYCTDVIEHVWNIDAFLASISKRLTKSGKLILVTPDVECDAALDQREAWWGFIVPHHAQLMTQRGLISALNRSGFSVIQYGTLGQEFWLVCSSI